MATSKPAKKSSSTVSYKDALKVGLVCGVAVLILSMIVTRAWQDDDPEATRKLADLSLATYGLRLRDDVLENGVREEDVLDGRATDAEE